MLTSLADELGRVTLEIRISQRLGEQIRRHVLGADEGDRHDAGLLHLARVCSGPPARCAWSPRAARGCRT